MCGIAGYIDNTRGSSEDTLIKMADTLRHRGPDDAGHEVIDMEEHRLGLAHRRLSIIDLSPLGRQPMHFRELSIVFNGEIYNYPGIRKELEETYGCSFVSRSDTEVVLQAFYHWGISCLERFIGMFSMALFDGRDRKLYLIRDRAGVKPLYYYHKDGLLLFASELKAFHEHPGFKKQIDTCALHLYLQYGYIPAPFSIFQDTRKVNPGHYLEIDLRNETRTEVKYWDVYDFYNAPKLKISYEEALHETYELLRSAFNYRMVADVPVGVFLSGGYDSTAVTAILQRMHSDPVKTFTIGFRDNAYNEAGYAKKVAAYLGTQHTEYYCTGSDALDMIPHLPFYFDEPLGDASAVPTMLVSRLAREHVTVALSADAGDETFAGYTRYDHLHSMVSAFSNIPGNFHRSLGGVAGMLGQLPFLKRKRYSLNVLAGLLKEGGPGYIREFWKRIPDAEAARILGSKSIRRHPDVFDPGDLLSARNDELSKVMAIDYKTYMNDYILAKVDRATMSVSLEGREPMLDHRIIEFAARLPVEFKYKPGVQKRILKDIVHQHVPREIMERPKMGFFLPLHDWLHADLKPRVLHSLNRERLKHQGVFDPDAVEAILERFYAGKEPSNDLFIWYMFIFQMWYDRWM